MTVSTSFAESDTLAMMLGNPEVMPREWYGTLRVRRTKSQISSKDEGRDHFQSLIGQNMQWFLQQIG